MVLRHSRPQIVESEIVPLLRKQKGFPPEITLLYQAEKEVHAFSCGKTGAGTFGGPYTAGTYPEVTKILAIVVECTPRVKSTKSQFRSKGLSLPRNGLQSGRSFRWRGSDMIRPRRENAPKDSKSLVAYDGSQRTMQRKDAQSRTRPDCSRRSKMDRPHFCESSPATVLLQT